MKNKKSPRGEILETKEYEKIQNIDSLGDWVIISICLLIVAVPSDNIFILKLLYVLIFAISTGLRVYTTHKFIELYEHFNKLDKQ